MAELKTFPSNAAEALTMLYLQSHNFSGSSPEHIAEKYVEIKERIQKKLQENHQQTITF